MAIYRFLVKAPTLVVIGGQRYNFSVGEVVEFPEESGQLIQQRQVSGSEYLDFIGIDPPLEITSIPSPPSNLIPSVSEPEPPQSESTKQESYVLENLNTLESSSDSTEVTIPLEPDAHWSTVRSFILEMEKEQQYTMIEAIKAKYSYPTVQEECDRILKKVGRI